MSHARRWRTRYLIEGLSGVLAARLLAALLPALLPALLAALVLAGCGSSSRTGDAAPSRVNAAEYDAFFVWAGVHPQPVMASAKTLYVLEAELSAAAPDRWQSRLARVPQRLHANVWIVYRVETLRWADPLFDRLADDVKRWRAAGNRVAGVQIDFDARTRFVGEYAHFLRDVRRRLPADTRLSITGLLDWGANADTQSINQVAGVVDEVVIQTYQGRSTIPGYADYLARLDRLRVPFRIGLVQGGAWVEPASVRRNPQFRGYVVFLVNP